MGLWHCLLWGPSSSVASTASCDPLPGLLHSPHEEVRDNVAPASGLQAATSAAAAGSIHGMGQAISGRPWQRAPWGLWVLLLLSSSQPQEQSSTAAACSSLRRSVNAERHSRSKCASRPTHVPVALVVGWVQA